MSDISTSMSKRLRYNKVKDRSSHSGGEESLSRSASDSSVSNANANQPVHKKSAPGTPQPTHGLVSQISLFFFSFL